MKHPAYPRYKDSGIEWLGELPEHWNAVRLKHVCDRFALYGANIAAEDYVTEGVRFLRTSDIDDLGDLVGEGVFIEQEEAVGYLLDDGDLLLSRSGTIGRSFLFQLALHPQSAYAGYLVRFVPGSRLSPRFAYYFTKAGSFAAWLETQIIATTIGNVNGRKFAQCSFPIPPLEEQCDIASFLDTETAKLDTLIEKRRALIEKLEEKRTVLISHAVTRGLPPEAALVAGLDPHPKLKDSGIEWLGEIPEHWKVSRLKTLLSEPLKYGANEASDLDDRALPRYVRITDIDDAGALREETFRSLLSEVAAPYLLREGDILFARSGATSGKTFLYKDSWGTCAFAGYLIRARLDTMKALPGFLRYFTASDNYWQWISASLIQATIQNVSAEKYGDLRLAVPPLPEQRAIADYLDHETAKIDRMVDKVETAIERLREYRSALITAAVTGKIDVRQAAA